MGWLIFEALLALALLVGIVAWTMSGRRRDDATPASPPQVPGAEREPADR